MAKFHYRYSAMNSGKTAELLRVADNYEYRGANVLVTKPSIDTKGSDKVISRMGLERPVDTLIDPEMSIMETVVPLIVEQNVSVLFVDEAQFLQPVQVDDLYWGVSHDVDTPVIAYGLRADFLSVPFPASERLLALADEVEEIATLCRCLKKARFNTRMVNGVYTFEGDQVAIDGEGEVTYDSLCKNCYRQEYLAFQAAREAIAGQG